MNIPFVANLIYYLALIFLLLNTGTTSRVCGSIAHALVRYYEMHKPGFAPRTAYWTKHLGKMKSIDDELDAS